MWRYWLFASVWLLSRWCVLQMRWWRYGCSVILSWLTGVTFWRSYNVYRSYNYCFLNKVSLYHFVPHFRYYSACCQWITLMILFWLFYIKVSLKYHWSIIGMSWWNEIICFFDTVQYCFCKLYKVRHFFGLPFVSQKAKQSNHNLWRGEQKYWNWARCLPKWGTVLAPNE